MSTLQSVETASPFPPHVEVPLPEGQSTATLFLQQAARTPDAVAIRFEGRTLSYAQLAEQTGRLAAVLGARGLSSEGRVAVLVNPGFEGIVALVGSLRAGVTYVPLDPDAPAERLSLMLEQCGAKLVLTQRALAARLPKGAEALFLDEALPAIEAAAPAPPPVLPNRAAYVIFTSGSTGEPKGVIIPQSALLNHNLAIIRRIGLTEKDRLLQFTPLHFDAAGEEIFPPLLCGATMVVRGELVPHLEFRELIEQERLSVLSLPPAYLHAWLTELVRQGKQLPRCLRVVLLGGEKLLPETRKLWEQAGGGEVPWFNVYGPTEATITAALCEISGTSALPRPVMPIGVALDNAKIVLVDDALRPVPRGEPGEICVGGAGLARGYLGRPDLTAERFIPDPFSSTPGARLYRTGDVGRLLPDGNLEFLGRVDDQVKLRGYRIELGEVESALRKQPGVSEAVAMLREDRPGDPRLVAYVTGGGTTPEALRDGVARALPEYMVPSAIVPLRALPLTPNGKVDKKALPPPPDQRPHGAPAEPKDAFESGLMAIWCEVLGVDQVSLDQNFFDIGGHSLAAIQMVSRIEEQFGLQVELRDVFETGSLRELAHVLRTQQGGAGAPGAVDASAAAGASGAAEVDVSSMSDEQVEAMLRELEARGLRER